MPLRRSSSILAPASGLCLLAAALILGPDLEGQVQPPDESRVVVVSETETCPKCEIQITHVVRLGSTDGKDAMWAVPLSVARIGTDKLLVAETEGGRLLLYDFAGNILDVFERRGEGPEEVGEAGHLSTFGPSSAAILDWANGRFAILEAGSGKIQVSRTVRTTGYLPQRIFSFDQSAVIGAGPSVRTADGARQVLHILRLGEHETSLEASFDPLAQEGLTEALRYRIVWADEDHIWSSSEGEYLIKRWGRDGSPEGRFRIQHDWFRGIVNGAVGYSLKPPDPFMNSLWTDEDGLLWVFTWRPSNAYQEGWKGAPERLEGGELFGGDRPMYHKLWNTHIDVIDPDGGGLVTSRTWISLMGGVLGDGLIWTTWQDEFGVPRIDIWQLRMSHLGLNREG